MLRGATLIDGTGRGPKANSVIIFDGDKILKVASGSHYRVPPGARVIDLPGRYITPGFVDAHVHSRDLPAIASTLLAFGITAIRSPSDSNGVGVERRLNTRDLLGPRLVTADRLIDHPANTLNAPWGPRWVANLTTEGEVRAEVRRQAARGVQYIKLYMGVPPHLLSAAVDEAHRRGVKAIGHLHCTGWTEAAEAEIDVLVHAGSEGPWWELLDDTSAAARGRAACGDFGSYIRLWAAAAPHIDVQGPNMERLILALLNHHVEVNPTLVVIESLYWGDDTTYVQRLEPMYAAAPVKEGWGKDWQRSNSFMRDWKLTGDEWAQLRASFETAKQMVRQFHERGVLITAGSDVAMPWITPGVAFHRELELLHSAGISNQDVLTIATRNGARALGFGGSLGTIEEGKRADLVVLTANPVEDIRNTRAIEYVVGRGHLYTPDELLKKIP